jgi:hypothetical protein
MPRVQTVQQTGKVWKLLKVAIRLARIAALIVMVIAMFNNQPKMAGNAIICLLLTLPMAYVARIGAWWFHG